MRRLSHFSVSDDDNLNKHAEQNDTYVRYGNDHGSIAFGDISDDASTTSGVLLQSSDGRHLIRMEKSGARKGNTVISAPNNFVITCGHDNETGQESLMIHAVSGNISLIAENGIVRIQGESVHIDATGSSEEGNVDINATNNVLIDAPKILMNAQSAYKLCTSGVGEIVANSALEIYSSIIKGATDSVATKDSKNKLQRIQLKNNILP
ncbi:MAG: hypothetical protein CBD74_09770 [Saprospirales bacterium TMED214]|nr:MAG: hypothetical protein CBD74_09770 [Saprospirales bacterium TMED214]